MDVCLNVRAHSSIVDSAMSVPHDLYTVGIAKPAPHSRHAQEVLEYEGISILMIWERQDPVFLQESMAICKQ